MSCIAGVDPRCAAEPVGADGKSVIGIDIDKVGPAVAREGASEDRAVCEFTSLDVVVFERTGGYERKLESAWAAAGVSLGGLAFGAGQAFRLPA